MDGLRVAKIDGVVLSRTTREPPHTKLKVTGTLHLTPHHLFFSPTKAHDRAAATETSDSDDNDKSHPAAGEEVWIPYPTIVLFQRLPTTKDGYPLQVATKTFDNYTLWFAKDREGGAEDVWQSVRDCAVVQSVEQLYAFFYTLPKSPAAVKAAPLASSTTQGDNPLSPLSASPEKPTATQQARPADGWGCYNARNEFARQGLGTRTKAWRFTDINKDYSFCPTYPSKLVVPSRISDSVLAYAAKYRSKARIPALTYLHWANHASITRSSQPMVGIKNARSAQDERLVECIFMSHHSSDSALALSPSPPPLASPGPTSPHVFGATATNLIIDARPTTNAMANVAKGAGTENMDWYRFGKKAYLGIDNIHVMRSSLRSVVEAIAEAETTGLPLDRERLRKSGWLKHISGILEGAALIVKNVHVNSSHVLIHCSDGWDRTSQLSAVAQLCLDPYYRTISGFQVLVEKDWLSFGHMFCQRSGHLSSTKLFTATPENLDGDEVSDSDDFGNAVKGAQAFFASVQKQFTSNSHLKEVSPVFHQFLDCVRQLQRQFPDQFEFTEDFLLDLHYQLYACQFGTFLFDSERQRRTPRGKAFVDRTVSAWEWTALPAQRVRYENAGFAPRSGDERVLFPDTKDVAFWHRLFKRGDDEMNAPLAPSESFLSPQAALEAEDPLARAPSPQPNLVANLLPHPRRQGSHSTLSSLNSSVPSTPAVRKGASAGGGGGWNWGNVRSGALSAFSQFKASASDAIQKLGDQEDEADPWGGGSGRTAYAAGTGIGEGRKLRAPLESNPWDTGAGPGRAAEVSSLHSSSLNSESSGPAQAPRRQESKDSWANPWDDTPSSRSLADLTLEDQATPKAARVAAPGSSAAGSVRGSAAGSIREASAPAETADVEPTPKPSEARQEKKHEQTDEERRMYEAALGGDSKAWDPLGAV